MQLLTWVAPILWMGVILWFSSADFSAEMTGAFFIPLLEWLWPWPGHGAALLLHGVIRKLAHLTEYAILALLWYRALARRGGSRAWAAAGAFAVAAAWAGLDELNQATLASRTGSPADVVLDATGAGIALTALGAAKGSAVRAGRFLGITALVGAAAFVALHLALGVGPGWLSAIVPGAWLVTALATRARLGRLAAPARSD